MRLATYLKKHKLSDAAFGEKAGLRRAEVWAIKNGRRNPRANKVAAIETATAGQVRAKDLQQ